MRPRSLVFDGLAFAWLLFACVAAQEAGTRRPAGLNGTGLPPLAVLSGSVVTRRILVNDEVREYVEINMEFKDPIYVRSCDRHDTIYVSAVKSCIGCERGCTHSSALSRLPPFPGAPNNEGVGECLCGISLEEMLLRAKGRPGDIGLENVERKYPRVYTAPRTKPPLKLDPYAVAMWQYDTLLANLQCPGQRWPLVGKLGLNGPPVKESLWWLRRFDTAFGIENIDILLANASAAYNDRQVVFFIPVSTLRHGRLRKLGPNIEELEGCGLSFPLLTGPRGQLVDGIPNIGTALTKGTRPCRASALAEVKTQIAAVTALMEEASQQREWCSEDWRSSYAPEDPMRADEDEAASEAKQKVFERNIRVGFLVWRSDFDPIHSSISLGSRRCAQLRWRLRLRSYNFMERAAMYTATDAVNGCWDLLQKVAVFDTIPEEKPVRKCLYEMAEPEYWKSPCCNLRLLRTQCCATTTMTVNVSFVKEVNGDLLASECRPDHSGGGLQIRAAFAAAAAWQRSQTEDSGTQSCLRTLATREQGHMTAWRTVQRCYRDIMGYYDRELRMYVGVPCVTDEDCFTECARPGLDSLRTYVSITGSKDRREVLGRCRVPTQTRHEFLIECLSQRGGPEIMGYLGLAMGVFPWRADTLFNLMNKLASDPKRRMYECVGPFVSRGKAPRTNETCLARKACNWNSEILTKDECEDLARADKEFCGCMQGHCPQLHVGGGCVAGSIATEDCWEARMLLRPREVECRAKASTVKMMEICSADIDLHNEMHRQCIKKRCWPDTDYQFINQNCVDRYKQRQSTCYDECAVPTGPNPERKRRACFMEMNIDEDASDCYRIPGDTQLHYNPIEGVSPLRHPEEVKPAYCSIRLWKELETVQPYRSRLQELARLDNLRVSTAKRKLEDAQRIEGVLREIEVEAAKMPLRPPGCDIGLRELQPDSKDACDHQTRDEWQCCLSPINASHAYCRDCSEANVTVCKLDIPILARWPPNQRLYKATLREDLGKDMAFVDWFDGGEFYREVPFVHTFDDRPESNTTLCIPVEDGCAAHHQCDPTEYCYSCMGCAAAFGGNPSQSLCAPCMTKLGGACGKRDACPARQDAIDDKCPEIEDGDACPCKSEWYVYGEYENAPLENYIKGCFFEKRTGQRWCEMDAPKNDLHQRKCNAKMITGVTRFIWWRECEPDTCEDCQCDCSEQCTAYNVLPFAGRLPMAVTQKFETSTLNYLNLTAFLSPSEVYFAGIIAPNCSALGEQRMRQACPFCVICCADYCHSYATDTLGKNTSDAYGRQAAVEGRHDCTSSNITGCSDLPRGWVDNVARTCADYETGYLCTPMGGPGAMWLYDPPRAFADFAMYGRSATQSCCACGGGVDCADDPSDWKDSNGHGCGAYRANGWCNRTGYAANWDTTQGPFPLGTNGVDARTACCFCGGGQPQTVLETTTHVVDELSVCMDAFPGGRAKFENPPWIKNSADICPLLNGICQHKLNAMAYYASAGTRLPDDPRIIGICEQKMYKVVEGKDFLLEDGQGTMPTPVDPDLVPRRLKEVDLVEKSSDSNLTLRRLKELDLVQNGELTGLGKGLQYDGATVTIQFNSNRGKGICFYKLPDPLGFWGGPRAPDHDPPWLMNESAIFSPPALAVLGWPWDFRKAMPAVPGKPGAEASSMLRALLATRGIPLERTASMTEKLDAWKAAQDAVTCSPDFAPPGYFKKYRQDVLWRSPRLADGASCMKDRCNVDPEEMDEDICKQKSGCLRNCAYCASKQDGARDQGMCYVSRPEDVARCGLLGGVKLDGPITDEISGVPRTGAICALPHRPLISCSQPGDKIKRCLHFGEEYCETDPLAKLMGCALRVRPCQTQEECQMQGRCSDVDLGLNWATSGTCVVSPVDDELLEKVCDVNGLCFFAVDPPFAMEIRRKYWMLDLLGPGNLPKGPLPAPEPSALDADNDRLRSAGRLNETECAAIDLGPGRKVMWLERQRTMRGCERWKGCCMASSAGGRCELFTKEIVDDIAEPEVAKNQSRDCELCGGEWVNVFRWETARGWVRGSLKKNTRNWKLRKWESANEWMEMVSADDMRRLYENVLESRIGGHRKNCVDCLVEPLLGALTAIADACGEASSVARVVADSAMKEVLAAKEQAEIAATTAEKKRTQAKLWQTRAKMILAESPPEPMRARIGSAIVPGNIPGRATFGGQAEITWHPVSVKPERPPAGWNADLAVNAGGTMLTLSLESEEGFHAMAAPQIALPGRIEDVRKRLINFVLAPDETAGIPKSTTPPPPLVQSNQIGKKEGYPAWLINEMIEIDNDPSIAEQLETEKTALLVANAEAAKKKREAYEKKQWAAADSSSGLPEASQRTLLDSRWPRDSGADDIILEAIDIGVENAVVRRGTELPAKGRTPVGIIDPTCRNVVSNTAGDVNGYLLGNCVRLDSSAPIINSVEICLKLSRDAEALNKTKLGQEMGIVLDLARRDTVPGNYSVDEAPGKPDLDLAGNLADTAWDFRTGPEFGILKPSWSRFNALGVPTSVRRGGSMLCGQVFEAGVSYCPIARIDARLYFSLPRVKEGKDDEREDDDEANSLPPLVSECAQMDAVLGKSHMQMKNLSKTTTPYHPLGMQAGQPEVVEEKRRLELEAEEEAIRTSMERKKTIGKEILPDALCATGSCLALAAGGVRIVPVGDPGSECLVPC